MSPKKQSTRPPLSLKQANAKLNNREISEQMKTVPGWKTADRRHAIVRKYSLPGFRAALAFVAWVGEIAEAHDHHPDIDIRFSTVQLKLSTHSEGGLTEKDFKFVRALDQG